MLLKVTGKVLLDRNRRYNFTVYRIHGYYCCSYYYCLPCIQLLSTVTVSLLSLYCPSNLSNMNIDWIK